MMPPSRLLPRSIPLLAALLSLAACGEQPDSTGCPAGTYAASTGACEAIAGTPIAHDFPDLTVTPGQEQLGQCRSWTLGNDAELWINAVELSQNEESHHANFVFVPEDQFQGPDGVWDCKDRQYDFYTAVNAGGVLYAQSTQATHEVQKFPGSSAVRVPPRARIISDIHLLNATDSPVTGHARLTIYTVPPSEVKVKLKSFHIEYDALDIPAHANARFTGDCAVAEDVAEATDAPFSAKIYYVLPHTHTLATRFFASVLGGPNDGQTVLDIGAYNGETRGKSFDPPVDLTGASGLRFGCQYRNTGDTSVGWGFAAGEMCELFAFADAAAFFESRVSKGSPGGTDGDVQLFTGPCETVVYP